MKYPDQHRKVMFTNSSAHHGANDGSQELYFQKTKYLGYELNEISRCVEKSHVCQPPSSLEWGWGLIPPKCFARN